MSDAQVEAIKAHIDARTINRDRGSHSTFDELRYVVETILEPGLAAAKAAGDNAAAVAGGIKPGGGSGKPDTYACVVDSETGAWYAVAPGHFWHIENMVEVNILRAAGVLVGESSLNHGDVELLRTMVLRAPGSALGVPPPATYTVVSGDTLSGIAAKTGKSVADLSAWNGISDPNSINIGQVLKLGPQ